MKRLIPILILLLSPNLHAATLEDFISRMLKADTAELVPLIDELAADEEAGPLDRKRSFLQAWMQGQLYRDADGRVLIKDGEGFRLALTDEPLSGAVPTSLETWMINNAVRRSIRQSLSLMNLQAEDADVFLQNLDQLEEPVPESSLKILEKRWNDSSDPRIRDRIAQKLAPSDLQSGDPAREQRALQAFAQSSERETMTALQDFLKANPNTSWRDEVNTILAKLKWRFIGLESLGHTLYGLSLASILLLVSLGLAITFGLMKIINMAHGEMLMIGAYTSYVLQSQMASTSWAYLAPLFAIPLAFLVSGSVGWFMERTIIRRLYGRPLETLLATWGISLILIQAVRQIFGAQNVEVAVPAWLSGGWTLAEGLVIPFNRIFAISVSLLVVSCVWIFFRNSRWGLCIRAVQQNRSMAACLRISTERIDAMTFAMGSGLAGIGGAILSQITNVGPELGQTYIIDSFLVVVLGGVGHIGGSILGALALGLSSKYLEAVAGAVMAKIIVMALIIIFIQKRPEGLLAYKGRAHVIDS